MLWGKRESVVSQHCWESDNSYLHHKTIPDNHQNRQNLDVGSESESTTPKAIVERTRVGGRFISLQPLCRFACSKSGASLDAKDW